MPQFAQDWHRGAKCRYPLCCRLWFQLVWRWLGVVDDHGVLKSRRIMQWYTAWQDAKKPVHADYWHHWEQAFVRFGRMTREARDDALAASNRYAYIHCQICIIRRHWPECGTIKGI